MPWAIRSLPHLLNHSTANLNISKFLVVTLGDAKQATPVINKTLNPEWNQSFDLPIVGVQSLLLEATCWDKDRFGKDYMGEFDVALDDVFVDGTVIQEVCCPQNIVSPGIC